VTDLTPLTGTWRGEGEGSYPTIEGFRYTEELVVEPVPGRPVTHWRSRTREAASGEPRHAESGFLRSTAAGLEFVVAHSFGVVETAGGSFDDNGVLVLSSLSVAGTPSAKRIDRIERRVTVEGDRLSYTVAMSAVGVPLTHHLSASLRRDEGSPSDRR
jgi:hypothetical protein